MALSTPLVADLVANTYTEPLAEGVHFISDPNFVQLDGPVGKQVMFIVTVPHALNRAINSVNLKLTTVTPNVIVEKIDVFDGNTLLQENFTCLRNQFTEPTQFKPWDITLGLLHRPRIESALILKIKVQFKRLPNDNRWDYGVVQFTSITAQPLYEIVAPVAPVMNL